MAVAGRRHDVGDRRARPRLGPGLRVARQQVQQSQGTEAGAGLEQPVAASQRRDTMGDPGSEPAFRFQESVRFREASRQSTYKNSLEFKQHMTEIDQSGSVGREVRPPCRRLRQAGPGDPGTRRPAASSSGSGCAAEGQAVGQHDSVPVVVGRRLAAVRAGRRGPRPGPGSSRR